MTATCLPRSLFVALALLLGCTSSSDPIAEEGVTAAAHPWFPITAGLNHAISRALTNGSMACSSCHDEQSNSFSNFTCISCHEHESATTDRLHRGVSSYSYAATSCYSCHSQGEEEGPFGHEGITRDCAGCHDAGAPFAALPVAGFTHGAITSDCGACHTTDGWMDASNAPTDSSDPGSHASSGSTASSTLDCNSCHGQSGTAAKHLSVAASSHCGGASNGNTCISCHVNFAGFKDTVANLKYAHTSSSANSRGCGTCHAFVNQVYTTLTNTPSLTYPVSSGGHTFSQTRNVTGSYGGRSFNANHTSAQMTNCGACHQYSTTSASTNVWTFKHRPSNPGISNSESSSGCNACH